MSLVILELSYTIPQSISREISLQKWAWKVFQYITNAHSECIDPLKIQRASYCITKAWQFNCKETFDAEGKYVTFEILTRSHC